MFNWLRKKKEIANPAPSSERVTSAAERRPVQNYVYPPVANGIPRFPVSEILEEHGELIRRLRNLSEHKAVFDERFRAVLERYANYVYLLPASEAHHHRGAGGLLRHGLETAKYVLQQAYDRLHGMQLSPQKRKAARQRWVFSGFVAGLIHDIGKPPADMRVYSVTGQTWEPFSQPLAAWYQALPPHDDRVYVSWRREGQDHRHIGLQLLNHILYPADLAYLQEVEPMLMWINQAILGEIGPRNDITEMVKEGDRKSVSQDLQKSNVLSDLGPQVGQPVARHIVMAMKRMIAEGDVAWRANQPGSVLWVLEKDQGVFLVWPETAARITEKLRMDETPGVPADADELANILEDHGLLAKAPNGNRLWRLQPSVVDAGEEGLIALRFKEPGYIMDLVPPSVSGEVRAEGEPPLSPVKLSDEISKNPKGPESAGDKTPPAPPEKQSHAGETGAAAPHPSLSIIEEPAMPQTLEDLQSYFAGGELGGQALLKFALEVSSGSRLEGKDYQTGPELLLLWGDRKFTEEVSRLPEVIESLARAGWLVLNGRRRVHEEPGFGKCLKLRELETSLFWRLVWLLGETQPITPGPEAPMLADIPEAANESGLRRETHPEKTSPSDQPSPQNTLFPEEEPEWVSEVAAMIKQHGRLDYHIVEELVKTRTGRHRKIMELVTKYFEVKWETGNPVVH
ncbi:MAG: MobH family relaxase [Desulfobaccales bacterium]